MTDKNYEVIIVKDEASTWCPPCLEINMMSNKFCKTEVCKDVPTPMPVDHCQQSLIELSYVSLHCL